MDRRKAIGYIRVIEENRSTIDEQKRNIENAVFENGYRLAQCYMDTGSGASLERDGIKKLLNDVRHNPVDAVFINSTDVLSTDKKDVAELIEALSGLNVRIYSVDGKRFLNAPADTLNNLSREIYNTLTEMEQNGVKLSEEFINNEKLVEKDPTLKLQNKIIEAYLHLDTDHRSQV